MKNFKFLNGVIEIERNRYNGVTDQYLIELSEELLHLSCWIESVMLTNDTEVNQDSLIISFKDIDGCCYLCTIFQDLSFELLQIIEDEFGDEELIDSIELPYNIRLDHNRILNYLRNMPKTIVTSL